MLSILIPVFNFDIRKLVNDLYNQLLPLEIDFEIICLDDGSKTAFKAKNSILKQLPNVIYKELEENMGRSKIRNELGRQARYNYLIFMDCDSKIVSQDYISRYFDALDWKSNATSVVYGGRSYDKNPPENPNNLFHWTYGIQREQSTAEERKKHPYHSFMTNNFLIPKKVFLEILFDENLTQYGHEDTLFGLELRERKIPIIHIDNPLEHIGLEETTVFINKSKKAIQNLQYLSQQNELVETRLLNFYNHLRQKKLASLFAFLFGLIEKLIVSNLKSKKPNLKLFDIYKLGYLCKIASK